MIRIKLCGLRSEADIDYANRLLPEYIGFVFAPKSKRYVSPEEALALGSGLDGRIKKVGVFVNAAPEEAAGYVERGIIDIIQLHGSEDEDYIRRLRRLTSAPVVKAFRIDSKADADRAEASSADCVLLDSGNGGTGTTFDHSLICGVKRPFFLAGGLSPENVAEITEKIAPFAVDASSSLEIDGKKDYNRMKAFVDAVRRKEV